MKLSKKDKKRLKRACEDGKTLLRHASKDVFLRECSAVQLDELCRVFTIIEATIQGGKHVRKRGFAGSISAAGEDD